MVIREANTAIIKCRNHIRIQCARLRVTRWARRQSCVVLSTNVGPVGQRAHVAAGNGGAWINFMLNAKIELVGVRIFDMRVVMPVHATGEERSWSGQAGANATGAERILVCRCRGAIRGTGTAWSVQVVCDQ